VVISGWHGLSVFVLSIFKRFILVRMISLHYCMYWPEGRLGYR